MNSRTNISTARSIVSAVVVAASVFALTGPAGAAPGPIAKGATALDSATQTRPVGDGNKKKGKLFDWVRFQIADFDGSGFVDADDVFSYMDAWMAGKPSTDTNGNGLVDSDDLYMFYLIWLSVAGTSSSDAGNPA